MKILLSIAILSIFFCCKSEQNESNIILINVDSLNRGGIARMVSILDSLNPKVLGVDLQFSDKTHYDEDSSLISSLYFCRNLVMISVIEDYDSGEKAQEYERFDYGSLPEYLINAKTGFANAILEDDTWTLKKFSTVEKVNGRNEYHFGVRVAMQYDSLRTMDFVRNNPKIVNINYQHGSKIFKRYSSTDILEGKISFNDIEGKIILLGYLGPLDIDKFYTPLNNRVKVNEPDIYGLEYLAYVIYQVLND